MILGLVTGTVTATVKHPVYDGRRLLLVTPLDERGEASGPPMIAVDHAQAGVGDRVLVLREGNGVRQILGLTGQQAPLLELVVGVVDAVTLAEAGIR